MSETKDDIRREFLARRRGMDADNAAQKSMQLSQMIIDVVDWSRVSSMHCFLPLKNDHEPDVRAVIEFALAKNIDVYTSDPSMIVRNHTVTLDDKALQQRIKTYSKTDTTQFDLVIVPMLGYDPMTRHRIGFGGGYYDRFLAGQHKALKLGVCYEEYSARLPGESHDVALDGIVTA